MQQRIFLGLLGALTGALVLISVGEWVRPSGANAQSQPTVPGCSNMVGGNMTGNQSNNCVFNIGPQKLVFSEDFAKAIADKMPDHKKLNIIGVGSIDDIQVAAQYAEYFKNTGYDVTFSSTGMIVPPPPRKVSIYPTADGYNITIAPSLP
jgi:hypothetical protein